MKFPKRSSKKGRDTACCKGAGGPGRQEGGAGKEGTWCKRWQAGTLIQALLVFIVQVKVYSEEGTAMTFTANLEDRVKKISEHVRAKTKIPVQDQVLLLGSKTLKPQRKLSSYGIDKQTTIHLTLKVVEPSDEELPLVLVELRNGGQRHLLQV